MSSQSFVSDTGVSQRDGKEDPGPKSDDVALLMGLSSTWGGLDPTAIVESILDCLLHMLNLDFVGIRFANTEHMFLRMSSRLETRFKTTHMAEAISAWFSTSTHGAPSMLGLGSEEWTTVSTPLGELASIGALVAGSRSADFPRAGDWLRLRIGAAQTSLACRELRDRSAATDPPDDRPDRPTGASLAESEWRLNLTINTIPAIVWSAAPDGLLDFVNQHFCDFVGLTSEEILGLGFYRIFHPDDTAHLLSEWQDIMSSGQPREVEGRLLRHDGEFRWCTLRQKPISDASGRVIKWYGVVLDIEDRKRAETDFEGAKSALVASEQNLKLIIDSLPVLAWSAKPDGSADFVNQSWTDYVGASAEQILDWGFLKFYHPDDIPSMVEIWKRDLAHSDRTSLKGRIRGADGNYRWFYFSGRKVTDVNGVVRWFGVNVDIDDLQRAQDALRDSEAAVRHSETAVRESEKRLSLVISTIPAMVWSATPDGKVDFFNKNLID
ncbi:MAG: PAS domain-containing protein, partial [Croceibacterium sp.]